MPKVLRLHKTGSNVEGWAITNQITSTEIKDIVDGAGGRARKINASIPTPFARMHLFETAFEFVHQGVAGTTNSIYHKFVTHFWDLWELLYNYHSYAQSGNNIIIRRWNKQQQLADMKANSQTKLLGSTLELYMADPRFEGLEDIFLFYFDSVANDGTKRLELVGGTSPLTFLFVSPNVQALPLNRAQNSGYYFDNNYVPLKDREQEFKEYIHKLFASNPAFSASFQAVYKSLDEQLLKSLSMKMPVGADRGNSDYVLLEDYQKNSVYVGKYEFPVKRTQNAVATSDLFVRTTNSKFSGDKPILLKPDLHLSPTTKYVNNLSWPADTPVPYTDDRELANRTLPGVGFSYPYLTINDLLQEKLVQVPYEVNDDRFYCGRVVYQPGVVEKSFNYLLPLTKLYFDLFTVQDLANQLTFYIDVNHVRVTLTLPTEKGQVVYERSYYENPLNPKDVNGAVIPEKGSILKAKVGLGIFPFYKFTDSSEYNDLYKVMLVDEDIDSLIVEKSHQISFYADGKKLESGGGVYSAKAHLRTKKSPTSAGSTYYEIKGTSFDFAELECNAYHTIGRALIVPKYDELQQGVRNYTFAIDFGTSNTHIAYTSNVNQKPQEFTVAAGDLQVVMLNKPSDDSSLTDYQRYHKRGFGRAIATETLLRREFMPMLIGAGGSLYGFPTRTATCEAIDFERQPTNLFGNINIGFTINTEGIHQDQYKQKYQTDLKWSQTLTEAGRRRIEAFFMELMLLIKHKAALNHGNVKNTKIVWFAPLSFDEYSRNMFQNVWDDIYSTVFKNSQPTVCITESAAPYYYLTSTSAIVPGQEENLFNVDIGGGTTDVLLFTNRKPSHSASFRFAGNDLWGDGFAAVKSGNDNGLLKYGIEHVLKLPLGEEGEEYRKYLKIALDNPDFTSSDLVSLLFKYDKDLKYSARLLNARHLRLMFYLHFGALVYHLAQLVNQLDIKVPRYICFSGQGSLYIKLLSAGSNLTNVERFAKLIIKKVTGQEAPANFKLVLVEDPKQVTANGGALAVDEDHSRELKEIPIIRPTGTGNLQESLTGVSKSGITSEIRSKVLDNVEACLELLLQDSEIAPLMKSMGVEVNAEEALEFMKASLQDSFTLVLENTLKGLSDTEVLHETMFFMPLKQTLYLLSKELHLAQQGATAV